MVKKYDFWGDTATLSGQTWPGQRVPWRWKDLTCGKAAMRPLWLNTYCISNCPKRCIYICIYTLYHMSACVCTCIITYNDRLNWSEYDLPNSWYLTFIGYKPSGWNAWYVLVPGIDWTPFTKRLHQLMVANDPFAQLMMANHRIWTENHH